MKKRIPAIIKAAKPFALGVLVSCAVYSFTSDFGDIIKGLRDGWNGKAVTEKITNKN